MMNDDAEYFRNILGALLTGRDLSQSDSLRVFTPLLRGELNFQKSKALLLLLAKKGATAGEISGCVKAIRVMEPVKAVSIPHLMDTCGTGGDGSHSFNISTVAALVIAGAGGKVAKHGNRAVSSRAGSSDLMEALGVRLEAPAKEMIKSIKRYGIGYFHAPNYHPSFAAIQPVRRALKQRTIFNLLGPLLNPLKLEAQMVGVPCPELLPVYAKVLRLMPAKKALIYHSRDGLDEISTSAGTDAIMIRGQSVHSFCFRPRQYGFSLCSKKDYAGKTARENSKETLRILKNRSHGPLRDLIILNAAAGLMISGIAVDIRQGICMADRSIASGAAYHSLEGLIRMSSRP